MLRWDSCALIIQSVDPAHAETGHPGPHLVAEARRVTLRRDALPQPFLELAAYRRSRLDFVCAFVRNYDDAIIVGNDNVAGAYQHAAAHHRRVDATERI